jgi:Arc/MetJ-type ribon-helix-helix transcriptional regulator
MNVSLSDDLSDFVRQKIECGQFPSEEAVLREAVRRFWQEDQEELGVGAKPTSKDLTDYEAIEFCNREVEGKEVPSIEEVRLMLSKIPGSMARAVIEERENRS